MRPNILTSACLLALLIAACGAGESTPAADAPTNAAEQESAPDASSPSAPASAPADSDTKFFTAPPAYAPPEDRSSDPATAPNYAPPED